MNKSLQTWLRPVRMVVAALCFAALTALFTSVSMAVPRIAVWVARVQIMPAALGFALGIFIIWIIATLLFGRVYCSTACPLGTFQDICARLARMTKDMRRRRAYRYSPPRQGLRYFFLVVTVASLLCGVTVVVSLLDPYSAYGRIASEILRPLWGAVLNLSGYGPVKIGIASLLGFGISIVTGLAVGIVAARHGRTVCNTVCPVGTTLGIVARYSIFHIDINPDKCIQCRKCEHVCKASCIDLISHVVDTSRCVVCFDCLPVCPNDAISYTPSSHRLVMPMMMRTPERGAAPTAIDAPSGQRRLDRRRFIATGVIAAMAPAVIKADRTARRVARTVDRRSVAPVVTAPVAPPGVSDSDQFHRRCTSCGLCVAHCPTGVLRPSINQYGVVNAMQPLLDFDLGRCSWNCTRCNNLCPTGALNALTLAEKRRTVIGRAVVIASNCVHCGRCAAECPRQAIEMSSPERVPVVSLAQCIGCGACQDVCPAYPDKAIYVDGLC